MAKSSSRRARRRAPETDEQRAADDAAKHAPVALASGGSYDREALQEGLDKVVKSEPDNRDEEVRVALERAKSDADETETVTTLPGHKLVDVDVRLAAGSEVETDDGKKTVGEAVARETRQVYDSDAEHDAASAASGGQPIFGHRSEVTNVEDAKPASDSESE